MVLPEDVVPPTALREVLVDPAAAAVLLWSAAGSTEGAGTEVEELTEKEGE